MTIQLNENEAIAAIQLFDMAVKSNGLAAAKNAIILTEKIKVAQAAASSEQNIKACEDECDEQTN